jgi:hypothetical protein
MAPTGNARGAHIFVRPHGAHGLSLIGDLDTDAIGSMKGTGYQPERDPAEHFKEAQREFIGVAGRFDLDPKARAAELREEMKRVSQEITKAPALMRQAERSGITSQVMSLVRQAEQERGHEKRKSVEKDDGLER